MTYPPDQIKARATTAQLLAAIEPFELSGCAFGSISTAYVRTMARDPYAESFVYGPATFETANLPAVLLILLPLAKPGSADPEVRTLRPFAELLVRHGIREARLIGPDRWQSWVEVTRDGQRWQKLRPITPETANEEPNGTP